MSPLSCFFGCADGTIIDCATMGGEFPEKRKVRSKEPVREEMEAVAMTVNPELQRSVQLKVPTSYPLYS